MPICITGMHRSGTSMVARLLNLCGLYLGPLEKMISPKPDNPRGFWENLDFVQVNAAILALLGGGWDFLPSAIEVGWEQQPAFIPICRKGSEIAQVFAGREPWGWKDPRTSLSLPFWKRLFPDLKVVICLRNPLEVAQSLHRRNDNSIPFGLNLWLTYNRCLLAETQPDERVITHFQTYFQDPQKELRRVLGSLGLPVTEKAIDHACTTISQSLRHNEFSTSELAATATSPGILALYKDLCAETNFAENVVAGADVRRSDKELAVSWNKSDYGGTTMKPLVSCIVSTGTRRSFLKQAIKYFLRQTYENKELVIVDDGPQSSSDLLPVDDRIKYIKLDSGMTLGSKLNIGIKEARGWIIQKIDDDDYYHPEFLASTVSTLLAHDSETSIIGFDCFLVLITATGELKFSGHGWFAGATLCFFRQLWEKGPFREDAQGVEDWFFIKDHAPQQIKIQNPELYILVRHDIDHLWTSMRNQDVTEYFSQQPTYPKSLENCIPYVEDRAFYEYLRQHA